MMTRTLQSLCLATLLLLCAGCWPQKFLTSPSVSGLIVDPDTGAPVDGATVFMSRAHYDYPKYAIDPVTGGPKEGAQLEPPSVSEAMRRARPPQVKTSADGRFSIPQEKRWGIYIVPMTPTTPWGTLVIRHPGYRDIFLRVSSWEPVDLGTLRLKRDQP